MLQFFPSYIGIPLCISRPNLIEPINNKSIAVGLVFGVGLALALNNWLLGIMFGIIFYVALEKNEKRKDS